MPVVSMSRPVFVPTAGGGGGGGIADGATITRTGPSASLPDFQEFLGGLTGDNNTKANGTNFSRTNWANESSSAVLPTWSNERVLNRATAVCADMRGSNTEYKRTRYFDTGASGYSSIYVQRWLYWSHNVLLTSPPPGQSLQFKNQRFTKTQTVVDGDGGYLSNWQGQNQGFFTNFENGGQDVIFYDNTNGNQLQPPDGGSWQRIQMWLKLNTALGTANGYWRARYTSTAAAQLIDNISTNRIFNGASDALTNFRYTTAQDFAGNGTDPSNTYAPPDNCNFVAFHDDEYIAGLRSGTGFPALAELCNNATYASATVIRQCEIVSISGTTWQVKINMPFAAFGVTDATGLYLALYDSAGSRTMVAV